MVNPVEHQISSARPGKFAGASPNSNGGSIVASGMTATPNVPPSGRDGFGFIEQMVEVDALDVFLPAGDYFLKVTPTCNLSGRSFDSSAMAATCIGTPSGNEQSAFFDSRFFEAVFISTANEGQLYDFSMGVNGDVRGGGGGITQTAAASRKHAANGELSLKVAYLDRVQARTRFLTEGE